jgi:SAM-dependent methyltransferase
MQQTSLRIPAECPVCRSSLLTLARRLLTQAAGEVDLFYCMDCESVTSPFAPEHLNGPTLNHHLKVFDRNQEYSLRWLNALKQEGVCPRQMVDVGCGIGSLLHAARAAEGIEGTGYDLDEQACEHGRSHFGLDLRGEAWHAESDPHKVDLIACIMVLEHIKWPRPLLRQLILAGRRHQCPIYVSVPWFNRHSWKDLDNPFAPGSLLDAPWVHVTNFSELAFQRVCSSLGAVRMKRVSAIPWPGYLVWC